MGFTPFFRLALSFALLLTVQVVSANDDCADAVMIDVDKLPFFTVADTTDATVDFADPVDNLRNLTCRISTVSRGVWYKMVGTDTMLQASVKSNDPDVAIRMAIFTGDACGDWRCLRPNGDYNLENEQTMPTSTWFARKDENYWLHITGVNASDVGLLELSIGDIPFVPGSRPENDSCGTAYEVSSFPKLYDDHDLTHAWPSPASPFSSATLCGISDSSRKLYYSFESNGTPFNVTLSDVQKTDNDDPVLEVAVMATDDGCGGGGGGAYCVEFRDFVEQGDEAQPIQVTPTHEGQIFIIVVAGEGFNDIGTFDLEFTGNESKSSSSESKRTLTLTALTMVMSTFLYILL